MSATMMAIAVRVPISLFNLKLEAASSANPEARITVVAIIGSPTVSNA